MSPTRWFESHVLIPLDRIYARLDEHAAELDTRSASDESAAQRRTRHRFRRAA